MFFEKIVERYPQLDEYWVIARSENKLKKLAEQHPQQKVRVVAVICGADSYDAIELFGKAHHEELKKILELPHGIPSHDTINRVFQSIDACHFERLFAE